MGVELARVRTRDGVRLDGVFEAARAADQPPMVIDAVLCIHGTGGSFYSSTLLEAIARWFCDRGVAALRVNTRGHDAVSVASTSQGGRRLGAAFEVVDDCRADLVAWQAWLRERGHARIALVGHSLGAVKALYAAADEAQNDRTPIVAVSPPRLSHALYLASAKASEFAETLARAMALVEEGKPERLMEVTFPLPMLIAAGGYVEKYGQEERYDYLHLLRRVHRPVLFLFGGKETIDHAAFIGAPQAIVNQALERSDIVVDVIPGADHFYSGLHESLIARMRVGLERLFASDANVGTSS